DEQRQLVLKYVGAGMRVNKVAQMIVNPQTGKAISSEPLERHFSEEIERGEACCQAYAIDKLYKALEGQFGGDWRALVWHLERVAKIGNRDDRFTVSYSG